MHYHVSRNGQTYGPYTLEDLQRYVASGNVLLTDLAKSDDMPDWVPVSQILSPSGTGAYPPPPSAPPAGYPGPGAPHPGPGGPYPGPGAPYPGAAAAAYPDPPNLHWGLVLLFGILTCGIFTVIYDLIQAAWLRQVQPASKALTYYIVATFFWLLNLATSMTHSAMSHGYGAHNTSPLGALASLIFIVMLIVARFSMRQSLEEHYNGPEPIGLRLSAVMTFFFGGLYFQYHFNRINDIRHGLRYR